MANSDALDGLIDHKILKVLRLFLADKSKKFYLREISIEAGVPVATTVRILKKLTGLDIIRLYQIRKFKFYQLSGNEKTKIIEQILK